MYVQVELSLLEQSNYIVQFVSGPKSCTKREPSVLGSNHTMCIRISPNQKLLKIAVVFAKFATIDLCPKGSGYDNHLESLVKIPSSCLYEKKMVHLS